MIPLNRPIINNSYPSQKIDDFVRSVFPNKYYHLTLSARQGLSEIYRKIKMEKGKQNVAVSPLTCVEAIYPIVENGHNIHFVDINPETLNMDEKLIPADMDIVQAIHFGGNPQNMDLISKSRPKFLVEDCAQCFGSSFNNIPVGLFGDYASYSFMKNIYSLGGGLVLSKSKLPDYFEEYKKFNNISTVYRYLKRLLESKSKLNNNISFHLLRIILKLKPENTSIILNSSINNKLIIKSIEKQLGFYNKITRKRIENAKFLIKNLNNDNLIPQKITKNGVSNHLRLLFILKKRSSKEAIKYLRMNGIGANHLSQNLLHPFQSRFDENTHLKKYVVKSSLPNYFELHNNILSIPISPSLKEWELKRIAEKVNSI